MFTKCAPGMGTKPRFRKVERDDDLLCDCGETFPKARRDKYGYDYCLACSTEAPKHANLPQHKQAYSYSTNLSLFRENCYGTHK